MNQTILRTSITKPPLFVEGQYEEYCRSMKWWVLLQTGISSDRLLAAVGMREVGPAKWVLIDYFALTSSSPSGRCIGGYMKLMDTRFKRDIEDLVLTKLSQRNGYRRKKDESIRLFWLRYDRLQSQLRGMNVARPERLQYMKIYHSLELSSDQSTPVNATMESCGKTGSVDELRRIAIRLLDVAEGELKEETFQTNDGNDDEDGHAEYEEDELLRPLQKPRAVKAKSRAGSLERSIQSTRTVFGVAGKVSADENQCLRCQQYGRWWGDFPKPFGRNLVSPMAKTKGAGNPTGGKGGKSTEAGEKGKSNNKTFASNEVEVGDAKGPLEEMPDETEAPEGTDWYGAAEQAEEEFWYDDTQWNNTFMIIEA